MKQNDLFLQLRKELILKCVCADFHRNLPCQKNVVSSFLVRKLNFYDKSHFDVLRYSFLSNMDMPANSKETRLQTEAYVIYEISVELESNGFQNEALNTFVNFMEFAFPNIYQKARQKQLTTMAEFSLFIT